MLKSPFYFIVALSICVLSSHEEALFPDCDAQLTSIEAIKDKCPFPGPFNFTNPASCCEMWKYETCLAKLIMSISECKPTRFAHFLTIEELRKYDCDPETEKCAHNPTLGFVKDISENAINPLNEIFEEKVARESDCARKTQNAFTKCTQVFENLFEGSHSLEHPDEDLCCSQWRFHRCTKKVFTSEASCIQMKERLESAFKGIESNIAKKGCPAGKFTCS